MTSARHTYQNPTTNSSPDTHPGAPKNTLRRYGVFLIGLAFVSFGIAFVTKAALGISPISAIPYSLSLIIPSLSLGNWTILYSLLLIALEILLLKKDANRTELFLQVVISFLFGYIIDFSLWILSDFGPTSYMARLLSLILGCAIIAFGVYLELIAGLTLVPGEAFVRAVSQVTGREFGTVKVISDTTMSLIAAALCLVFLRELKGVREGTILAAFSLGNLVKFYGRIFKWKSLCKN